MILTDSEVLKAIEKREIVIEPFRRECLGPNSYDVHLSEHAASHVLVAYGFGSEEEENASQLSFEDLLRRARPLDVKWENEVRHFDIPPHGFVMRPGVLYLCSTEEYTETHAHVPYVDGRSSVGRLGISIHLTAGRGDVGFCGHWTLEITVVHPVRVYPGMPIGQITFHEVVGQVTKKYGDGRASYNNRDPHPMPSQLWKKFRKDK